MEKIFFGKKFFGEKKIWKKKKFEKKICVGPIIRIGREIRCLPYAGFFCTPCTKINPHCGRRPSSPEAAKYTSLASLTRCSWKSKVEGNEHFNGFVITVTIYVLKMPLNNKFLFFLF